MTGCRSAPVSRHCRGIADLHTSIISIIAELLVAIEQEAESSILADACMCVAGLLNKAPESILAEILPKVQENIGL
jgi:hypothetical protein